MMNGFGWYWNACWLLWPHKGRTVSNGREFGVWWMWLDVCCCSAIHKKEGKICVAVHEEDYWQKGFYRFFSVLSGFRIIGWWTTGDAEETKPGRRISLTQCFRHVPCRPDARRWRPRNPVSACVATCRDEDKVACFGLDSESYLFGEEMATSPSIRFLAGDWLLWWTIYQLLESSCLRKHRCRDSK